MSSRDEGEAPIAPTVEVNLVRRRLLLGGAVAGIACAAAAAIHDGELGAPPQTFRGTVPWQEGTADAPPGVSGSGYVFFTPAEVAFIEAAVGRLIPDDAVGPGAVEANVPFFLDRQLAGKFGQGDHFYLGGPWPKGTSEQGYQGRFNPAQLYRACHRGYRQIRGQHVQCLRVQHTACGGSGQGAQGARERGNFSGPWRRQQKLLCHV